jgi:hypothetical protein
MVSGARGRPQENPDLEHSGRVAAETGGERESASHASQDSLMLIIYYNMRTVTLGSLASMYVLYANYLG